jgi:hypothetical protein
LAVQEDDLQKDAPIQQYLPPDIKEPPVPQPRQPKRNQHAGRVLQYILYVDEEEVVQKKSRAKANDCQAKNYPAGKARPLEVC